LQSCLHLCSSLRMFCFWGRGKKYLEKSCKPVVFNYHVRLCTCSARIFAASFANLFPSSSHLLLDLFFLGDPCKSVISIVCSFTYYAPIFAASFTNLFQSSSPVFLGFLNPKSLPICFSIFWFLQMLCSNLCSILCKSVSVLFTCPP
jgi:hypothetical protein